MYNSWEEWTVKVIHPNIYFCYFTLILVSAKVEESIDRFFEILPKPFFGIDLSISNEIDGRRRHLVERHYENRRT